MLQHFFGRRASAPALDLPRSDLSVIADFADAEFTDVEGLCEALGLELQLQPYRRDLTGTLQRFGRHWVVGVNRADTLTRRRFTIAHEIGHYVMHRDLVAMREGVAGVGDGRDYRQPDIPALANPHVLDKHETQANRVAVMILMKEDKMRRLMAEGLSAEDIGMVIGCSAEATRIRLKGLTATAE